MDAERTPAVTDDDSSPASGGDSPLRRAPSASQRLRATLAAADQAAEELLDAARAEARELIERAEQVATDRTAQLQTQADILLTRANDLTQQAQALGEATRELTGSVNRVISIEAPAVTELELTGGEREALEAPKDEPEAEQVVEAEPESGPAPGAEPEPEPEATAEAEATSEPDATEPDATPEAEIAEAEVVSEPEPAAEAEAAAAEEEEAPVPSASDATLAELGALTSPPAPPPEPETAAEEAPEAPQAPTQAPSPAAGSPRGSGSQPPPSQPQPPVEPQPAAAEEPPEGKKRRGLFSRLRRDPDADHTGERAPADGERRPRASAEAIAEVSPGHQMLARQMLLDGVDEKEVERRLREEFRVRDPGAVLDSLQLNGPVISPTKPEGTNEREP